MSVCVDANITGTFRNFFYKISTPVVFCPYTVVYMATEPKPKQSCSAVIFVTETEKRNLLFTGFFIADFLRPLCRSHSRNCSTLYSFIGNGSGTVKCTLTLGG